MIYTFHTLSRSFSHAFLTDITGTLQAQLWPSSTLSLTPNAGPPSPSCQFKLYPPSNEHHRSTHSEFPPLFKFISVRQSHLTSDPPSISIWQPHLTSDPPFISIWQPYLQSTLYFSLTTSFTSDPHTSDPPFTKADPHPLKPI